jgi:hypothetical protein
MQAEAAAAAGERAVRGFMVAVQRATSNVALVQQVRFLDLINILLMVALSTGYGSFQERSSFKMIMITVLCSVHSLPCHLNLK